MYANYSTVKAVEQYRYGQERNYPRRKHREPRPARKAAHKRRPHRSPATQVGRS